MYSDSLAGKVIKSKLGCYKFTRVRIDFDAGLTLNIEEMSSKQPRM